MSSAKETAPGIAVPIVLMKGCGPNKQQEVKTALYLDETAYKSLMVQLHLLENSRGGFELVYPNVDHPDSGIKIWRIKYPKDISMNRAYLERAFPNNRLYEPLQGD